MAAFEPISCGNAGAGSMRHFMAILLARESGMELLHTPYKGDSAAMQSVASGDMPRRSQPKPLRVHSMRQASFESWR